MIAYLILLIMLDLYKLLLVTVTVCLISDSEDLIGLSLLLRLFPVLYQTF